MKKYIKPQIIIQEIQYHGLLAASSDEKVKRNIDEEADPEFEVL